MSRFILLTLDVEEFDLPLEYGVSINDAESIAVSSEGLERIIELLESLNMPSTCFTTTNFASNQRNLICHIANRHEIASHGYFHSKSADEDLKYSKMDIEKITGKQIYGYRHARLTTTDTSRLLKAGYIYDSSINPIWLPGRYMNLFKPRLPYNEDGLWRLPISVSPVIRYPLFWLSFKNSPLWLIKSISKWTLNKDGYLNILFHTWEFADIKHYKIPSFIKHPSGNELLKRFEAYLRWLIKRGEFITCSDYIKTLI